MRRKLIIGGVALLGVVIIIGLVFGYRAYDSSAHFVSTDNALVQGDIVQVAPMAGGRVAAINVDVGDNVRQGQTLATIDVPVPASGGAGASTLTGLATTDLVSPLNGIVIARRSAAGSVVSALQPVISVVDLGKLWVTANVDEGTISRVKVGDPADVHVDTLDKTFEGRVLSITPASAASLLAGGPSASNATSDVTKVGQLVPVRISLDYAGSVLMPGTSAEVDIRVS